MFYENRLRSLGEIGGVEVKNRHIPFTLHMASTTTIITVLPAVTHVYFIITYTVAFSCNNNDDDDDDY